jgi:hypothetical protein
MRRALTIRAPIAKRDLFIAILPFASMCNPGMRQGPQGRLLYSFAVRMLDRLRQAFGISDEQNYAIALPELTRRGL